MHADGQLIGHGAGRDKHGGLLAEQVGGVLFERLHGGVVAQHVVADHGLGHGLAHAVVGLGDGVAPEVDFAVEHGRGSIPVCPDGGNAFGTTQAA